MAAGRVSHQGGFGLIETMIGITVLALAMLGYVSTSLSHQRLAEDTAARTEVHQVARNFMERLRGDAEWGTLYARLRALQVQATTASGTGTRLEDGRLAFPPTAYYSDIKIPDELTSLVVLVDVPFVAASGTTTLREDATDARYGLPADLNGDGALDSEDRAADYVALPVVATFRWTPRGEAAREMRLSTALRGQR